MSASPAGAGATRGAVLRRAIHLEAATMGYNALEGVIALAAGVSAGSVALIGFGLDSAIEVTSALVLWRRLRAELAAPRSGPAAESQASRRAGALLLLLGVYIVVESGRQLLTGVHPEESRIGIALLALSLVVMPLLARAKPRAARALGSRALRADAHETIVCAWLSLTALCGLVLNATLGWWWADPVAAVAMVPLIVREGLEAWQTVSPGRRYK
jgi:divalent metal cation (Fe/Co/Zn/Cd) transporter